MNEKLSYAEMLDIPLTSTVTIKPKKKRKFFGRKKVDIDGIKETLIEKVNETENETPVSDKQPTENQVLAEETVNDLPCDEVSIEKGEIETVMETPNEDVENHTSSVRYKKEKPKKKSRVIGFQLAVIFALAIGIFITNAVMPTSGINVFFNEVFGSDVSSTDVRDYTDFSPELSSGMTDYALDSGVISINGKSSLYSPCNGTVSAIEKTDDGKFTVTVSHSDKFSTVISGMDYCYVEEEGKVLANVPVGYVKDGGAKMCFYGELGAVIVNFTITDNAVVWAV